MFTGCQSKEDILADFATYISAGKVQTYRAMEIPLVPGKREGCRLWDLDGSSVINCRSSGGVFNLGHRPPRVIAAVRAALDELDIGDHILVSEQRAALARRLAQLLPGDLRYTVFAACGGEAIDLAIKLARGYTGRIGVISAEGGYHGHTGLALAAGHPQYKAPFEPLAPGFVQVPFGDITAMERAITEQTAAVLLETIPATAGILIPPDDYYPRLRRLCDERGALLILDEVQAGLGRTGRLWAFEEWGIVPDMVVLGKGLSGGIYPMAATCYRVGLQEFLDEHPFIHVSTFGGADLGCVAAQAMFDQITEPGFLEHVREMGTLFAQGLTALRQRYPRVITGIRQRGLMIGIQMADDALGPMLTVHLGRNGVLALFANNRPSTMIIMPPLIMSEEEVGSVLDALQRSLAAMTAGEG